MANTPGDGGVDICLVSPSDQAGQINNLLDRVHNLEVAVAQLAGLNVNATNLSDMIESLGTVTNGTLLFPDNSLSGWTNSIPPGDFSGSIISNGIITTWENGVVSFQVEPSGITTGGGGVSSYLLCEPASATLSGGKPNISTINSSSGSAFNTTTLSSGRVTMLETGFYWCSIRMMADVYSTTGYKYMEATGYVPTQRDYIYVNSATYSTETHKASYGLSFGFVVSSLPYYFDIVFTGASSLMASAYQYSSVNVAKLA